MDLTDNMMLRSFRRGRGLFTNRKAPHDLAERVVAAMAGACPTEQVQAVGVMETFSLASSISAADTAVKAADVELIEVRLGRGMGGKSFVIVTGEVAAVEAAVQAAEGSEQTQGLISSSVVIPSPHMDIVRALM